MSQKFRPGTCIYCNTTGQVTDDHVPPKNLFAKPRPSDLITVPACDACNKSFSVDDEYFRMRLSFNDQVYGHPDVNANLPAVFRSLQRPQAKGMSTAFFNDIHEVELKTKSGLYVKRGTGFKVDFRRMDRVVARTVRGLFFKETGDRLADDYGIRVLCNEYLDEESPEALRRFGATVFEPVLRQPLHQIGHGTFSYRFAMTDRPPNGAWSLTFYGKIPYLALIVPKEAARSSTELL